MKQTDTNLRHNQLVTEVSHTIFAYIIS